MNLLRKKTILITGGSMGIGLVVAEKCAEEGASIIIAARSKEDLLKAASSIKKISNNKHNYYSLDVSNLDEVKKFSEWVNINYSKIDGLVNCAGIYGSIGKTPEIDLDLFKKTLEINFLGTVYMSCVFTPLIHSETKKKIINYSGGGAASPFPNYSAYATSKVAIVRFTENLSLELAEDNFDINCIAPGFVVTRLHQQTLKAGSESAGTSFYQNTKEQIEKGGVPPEKAANLTVFLLSEKSDGITGKFISAQWDPWQDTGFQTMLREDKNLATLRRIDNKYFAGIK